MQSVASQQPLLMNLVIVNSKLSFYLQQTYDKMCLELGQFTLKNSEFSLANKLQEIVSLQDEISATKNVQVKLEFALNFPNRLLGDFRRVQL